MHKELIGQTEFTFRKVESTESLEDIYRLRYQVYCKECFFLKEQDYPDGLEQDKYDTYSSHFLAADTQGPIGTARLIFDSPLGFPFEEHCAGSLTINPATLNRKKLAEVSRLVISKEYRRRRGDGLYYTADADNPGSTQTAVQTKQTLDIGAAKRIRPMAFGLYREMYQESKRLGITHWVAVMEMSLRMLLRMHNFIFYEIGPEVDYYGPVKPYIGEIAEIERGLNSKMPALYNYFLDGLEPEYRPKT